jgi:hypothetical protein
LPGVHRDPLREKALYGTAFVERALGFLGAQGISARGLQTDTR